MPVSPTPAPAPAPTPPPFVPPTPPPPPPPSPGSSRDDPIPFGTTAILGDWRLRLVSVTPDATAIVDAEDEFNDPPPAGYQDFIANVQATYVGATSAYFGDGLRTVGTSAVSYDTWSCGVILNELPWYTEVFPGGTISGNVCWQIEARDAIGLVMYGDPDFDSDHRVYFSLTP